MKSFFKALLLALICLPFCHVTAKNKPLANSKQDLLMQCLQKLDDQKIILAPDITLLLVQDIQELENQGKSPEQIIEICCDQAKQKQLALDDERFYKNLMWAGAGCLVIAGIGIVAYMIIKKNEEPVFGAEESQEALNARLMRIAQGNYDQNDVQAGFQNINRIIAYDPDPQLRRILGNVVINNDQPIAIPPLTDAELRAIPLATFHEAGRIVQENLIGWNAQRTVDEINELIDVHLGRVPGH